MRIYSMPDPHWLVGSLLTVTASRSAWVEVTSDGVAVRLGRTWRAEIDRSAITSAARDPRRTITIGAHGWRGEWLVNTSPKGLVRLTMDPPAPAHCLGVPIKLKTLIVSLADPDDFLVELGYSRSA